MISEAFLIKDGTNCQGEMFFESVILGFCLIYRSYQAVSTNLFYVFSLNRLHWADLVIGSPCPFVCVLAPSGAVFFEASH